MSIELPSLVILGAGGHAKVVIETAKRTNKYSDFHIFDDNSRASRVLNYAIAGKCDDALSKDWCGSEFFVAIGNNDIRSELIAKLHKQSRCIATLIDPSAMVSQSATIGAGVIIVAGAIVNADAVISDGSIINTAATVDHDCVVAECAHIAPGVNLCGGVKIGENALIGVGSSVLPGCKIGKHAVVGGGSTVIRDINANVVVAGSPAVSIR